MIVQDVLFWLLAAITVAASILVLRFQDLFRAALMLVVTFGAMAGLFVLLNAEFLAVVQVLVYIGAIAVLIIFGVLLTQDIQVGNPSNSLRLRLPALTGAGLVLVALVFVIADTQWDLLEQTLSGDSLAKVEQVLSSTPEWLAGLLLQEWVLAFEAVSLLLLAAIIGAIVLVRERQS